MIGRVVSGNPFPSVVDTRKNAVLTGDRVYREFNSGVMEIVDCRRGLRRYFA